MGHSLLRLVAAILMTCWSSSARAQLLDQCNVSFDPVVLSQPYNPLSPDDYIASFTATARRPGLNAGAEYGAVLLRPLNYQLPSAFLFVVDDDGAGTGNVLYARPGPNPRQGLNDAGEIDLDFDSSLGLIVTRTFTMQLRISAGTAIDPGSYLAEFDVKYRCDYPNAFFADQGTTNRGFAVRFTVSNAVQASLVGSQPDFGEIGTLSNLDVAGAPPSTTQRRHYMRVASTGPYEVNVVSQNGWRMTASGGPTSNTAERINYRYELLGQTLHSGRPNFTPVRCQSSGLSGENIALTATLTEGGQGKLPSPVYRDIIRITVAPLAMGTIGTRRCE